MVQDTFEKDSAEKVLTEKDYVEIESIKARVLTATVINGHNVAGNRVALISSDIADSLTAIGAIDDNVKAVDYALTLNEEIIDTTVTPD